MSEEVERVKHKLDKGIQTVRDLVNVVIQSNKHQESVDHKCTANSQRTNNFMPLLVNY